MRWFANKMARFHLEAAVESGHKTSRLAGQFFLRWVFWGYLKRTRKITGETKKKDDMVEMSILIFFYWMHETFWEVFFFHSRHFSKIWSWYQYKGVALVIFLNQTLWKLDTLPRTNSEFTPEIDGTGRRFNFLLGPAIFVGGAFAVSFSEGTFGLRKDCTRDIHFLEDHPRTKTQWLGSPSFMFGHLEGE